MTATEVVLGLDVSTTATKAVLVDPEGGIVGVSMSEYGYQTPHPLWSEQDPLLWWTGTVDAVTRVLGDTRTPAAAVRAVGLSGQMHGLVLLDADGTPVRPAILWNDQRTGAECDTIRARLGRDRLIRITGNDALTGFTAPKLLWVRDHEPGHWARARHMLLPKDFVRHLLTGGFALDVADGAGTLLFDLGARTWSSEVVDALGLDPEWLPSTHEGPEITGTLSGEAARATGLAAGTPVVAGGGDQAANAVGVGAVVPGTGALSVGTSGVVFAPTSAPVVEADGRLHAFCHAVPGAWHLMGVMLSAAGSLRWLRDAIAPGASYGELAGEAAAVPVGADGLLFLPYLSGERTPHPDPLARGAFVGLTVRHGRAHLVRAVLEGVAFGLRDCLELVRGTAPEPIVELRASGGGTRSDVWRQVLADVLGATIATTATAEGAATGAAILAAVGAGWHRDVASATDAMVRVVSRTAPGPDAPRYGSPYGTYRSLYPSLQGAFQELAAISTAG
jgi:xylulokinase